MSTWILARQEVRPEMPETVTVVDLFALGTTAEGHPVHPLYQPADADLEPFTYGGEQA